MTDRLDSQLWKERGVFHCLVFVEPTVSIHFRAPSWRRLKGLCREHGYQFSTREREVREAWETPDGELIAAGGRS